ncbi:MAG TPA: PEP-CTERM sorting domain-containing protein [Rariglobus sp.]
MTSIKALFVSASLALLPAHSIQAQAIVGAWTYGNTATPDSGGAGVLVFLANGAYFHAESENTDGAEGGANGMERGTYTWNAGTGAFTSATAVDTNGEWGLFPDSPAFIDVTGNSLTIDDTTMTRVTGGSAIVGAWTYGNALDPDETGTGVLIFLANGIYFHAESDNTADAENGQDGMERGTYTWNADTGAFTAETIVNTNMEWGLSDEFPAFVTIDTDTLNVDGTLMTRIGAVPEPSTYTVLAGLGVLGAALCRRRGKVKSN